VNAAHRIALASRLGLLATAFAAAVSGIGASARTEIPAGREPVPVERITCEPQDFAEMTLAGRTFTIPPDATPEATGGGAPDPAISIASLIVRGTAKEVSTLYRCLLQQSGYGLTAAGESGDTAPVYFNDGMALSGQIFIGQVLDAEAELTRIVIVARADTATGN
jgi:hypothetical protein